MPSEEQHVLSSKRKRELPSCDWECHHELDGSWHVKELLASYAVATGSLKEQTYKFGKILV